MQFMVYLDFIFAKRSLPKLSPTKMQMPLSVCLAVMLVSV